MACSPVGACRWARVRQWLLVAGAVLLGSGGMARAADVETRDFAVLVDGKPAGDAHMTIHRQDDGSVIMTCDTDIKVSVLLVTYRYSYRGREVWKNGRLQRFDSTCNDDGKRYLIAAMAEGDKVRLRVNDQERLTRGDVWLTSYWAQPPAKVRDQVVPLVDADSGRDLEARVSFVGGERRSVIGKAQTVNHFRLSGKVAVDLWYDVTGRLVRQEWVEEGHRTLLELSRLRR